MTHRVAALPGDGTGPEVVREGLKVLEAAGVKLDLEEFDLGGERYKKTGDILPDSVLEELRGSYRRYKASMRPCLPRLLSRRRKAVIGWSSSLRDRCVSANSHK